MSLLTKAFSKLTGRDKKIRHQPTVTSADILPLHCPSPPRSTKPSSEDICESTSNVFLIPDDEDVQVVDLDDLDTLNQILPLPPGVVIFEEELQKRQRQHQQLTKKSVPTDSSRSTHSAEVAVSPLAKAINGLVEDAPFCLSSSTTQDAEIGAEIEKEDKNGAELQEDGENTHSTSGAAVTVEEKPEIINSPSKSNTGNRSFRRRSILTLWRKSFLRAHKRPLPSHGNSELGSNHRARRGWRGLIKVFRFRSNNGDSNETDSSTYRHSTSLMSSSASPSSSPFSGNDFQERKNLAEAKHETLYSKSESPVEVAPDAGTQSPSQKSDDSNNSNRRRAIGRFNIGSALWLFMPQQPWFAGRRILSKRRKL